MRYFLTHVTDRKYAVKYNASSASYNFCVNLIESGVFDKVYNILPTNIGRYKDPEGSVIQSITTPLRCNIKLFRCISCIIEQFILLMRIKKNSTIWFYNLNSNNVLLFSLLKILKPSVGLYIIFLDYNPDLRENKYYIKLINKCKGIITLSSADLFLIKNVIVMPGVTPLGTNAPSVKKPIERSFLLSGNLFKPISMMKEVLTVFSQLPSCILHITGVNADKELIESYANQYDNIIWHDAVEYDVFLKLLHSCPFVLSTRDIKYQENKYNFPSKVIEALLNNRIIISTIKYPQLGTVKYLHIPSALDEMLMAITSIINLPDDELMMYANQSSVIEESFNNKVWKENIIKIEKQLL